MTLRRSTSALAILTVMATPAIADITAGDVLANQQAYYNAMGVSLNGELSGDQLTNPEVNIVLPTGIASFQIRTDPITMDENGDGTVSIRFPSPMTISIAGAMGAGNPFSAEISASHDEYTVTASGDPDNITYDVNLQNLSMEIGEVSGGIGNEDSPNVDGTIELASWVGTAQVSQGNVITRTSEFELGVSDVDITFGSDSVEGRSTQTTQPLVTQGTISLPAAGSDIMNLAAAVPNGLSFNFVSEGGASVSTSETRVNGDLINSQDTKTGEQQVTFAFDENGLQFDAEGVDMELVMTDSLVFPGEIEFGMAAFSMNYDVPLIASEDVQDFRVATSLQGVTLGDQVWNLFDPAGLLPRDPAEISFDITGNGTNQTDLLNFMAMSQSFGPPAIEVDDMTIENLRIAAAGAEVTATGSMTFDWTDFQTIPGIARPEGQVTVNLNGANALMDTLAEMGLFAEEDLMMPRMMLGMFATPVGDDMLETVLEVNSEGHVLANGQRLQ